MDAFAPLSRILPRLGFLAGDFPPYYCRNHCRYSCTVTHCLGCHRSHALPHCATPRRALRLSQLRWPALRRRPAGHRHCAHGGWLRRHLFSLSLAAWRPRAPWARLRDELSGEEFYLAAGAVVNATGVWAGQVDESIRVRPSRGTHIVLAAENARPPHRLVDGAHPGPH